MKNSFLPSETPVPSSRNRVHAVFLFVIGIAMTFAAAWRLTSSASHPVLAFSKQSRAAGAVIFREKGCEHCHGVDGIGTDRGPDLSDVGKRWHKDRIEKQIREGGGGMPPFGDALQPDEIKLLVDFLGAKRKPSHEAKKPQTEPPVKPSSDDSGF